MRIFQVKTIPTLPKCLSMVITHLMMKKNTSILTASIEYIISAKRLDAPLIQNWHINFSMCSLSLVFVKKLLVNVFYLALYFLYLWLFSLDYFVKWFILLDFSLFSFEKNLYMFHQRAKICSKYYNWIVFKSIFLYLIDFGAGWFPGTPKDMVPGDRKFSVKMCNT